MIGRERRSTSEVSFPSACHVSPRSVVFHTMSVPAYKVEASWGEITNGPSQLAGAMAFPSRCSSGVPMSFQVVQLRRAAMWPRGLPGRMAVRSPVRRSKRDRPRYWDSV